MGGRRLFAVGLVGWWLGVGERGGVSRARWAGLRPVGVGRARRVTGRLGGLGGCRPVVVCEGLILGLKEVCPGFGLHAGII